MLPQAAVSIVIDTPDATLTAKNPTYPMASPSDILPARAQMTFLMLEFHFVPFQPVALTANATAIYHAASAAGRSP
jgi:hypothetical protein